ncbi:MULTISPECIES: hypothetical protein [Bacillus cereus group]|uniref:hypothetical protein n=1 Tax=Bacillus cereus group TaxID=86661 RepID=UPI000CD92593|nr:hypothetical protein [Bacillus thuringiensis]
MKSGCRLTVWPERFVAPLVGARIEIIMNTLHKENSLVAPLIGARIEVLDVSVLQRKMTVAPIYRCVN